MDNTETRPRSRIYSSLLSMAGLKREAEAPALQIHEGATPVFERGPSREDVTRMLRQHEYSFRARDISGLSVYYGAQLPAKSPCEQRFLHGRFPSPYNDNNKWMAWGLFDGYNGWETADILQKYIMSFVNRRLQTAFQMQEMRPLSDDVIENAMIMGFKDLDDFIVKPAARVVQSQEPPQDKIIRLAPCQAGSSALVLLYDPKTRKLHVACTGNSKGVLASWPAGAKRWTAMNLSEEQDCYHMKEIERLQQKHPGEDIIQNGMLFGTLVTRAFGDAQLKWPMNLQIEVARNLRGRLPSTTPDKYLTPPYLTATPAVTRATIHDGVPHFVILATASFWQRVSNQTAVDLVVMWWRADYPRSRKYESFSFARYVGQITDMFLRPRSTVLDDNVAVHLIRNVLGGDDHDMVASHLAFMPPFTGHVRSDMTVQVIFFNVEL
ncbi:hypothetical protein O1611_g7521 [Lasiodiplodia mahajangana]|uniref:Uncharacterized protein n=1 Tax=Lasiodiplodia mahajangana TaxID=1108764 RepID=A0ACC2JFB6_9PEZI|nr:hypothetical protein O1611_g7521 [Lasiodiplodia mahajangana]